MDSEEGSFTRDIVVIGGSSGAIDALKFIGELPADFPAAILIVVHIAAEGPGLLPQILGAHSKIPVKSASTGLKITPGCIYIAPPDHHLTVVDGVISVMRGPKENRHRPSVDVLFRSAAKVYGARVIGVVLSGMLDDGSAGLLAIRSRGGLGIVQEPGDALFPDMPRNALACAGADHTVPRAKLAAFLLEAVTTRLDEKAIGHFSQKSREYQASEQSMDSIDVPGQPTNISCPDCGGVLQRLENGKMLRFKCRVGHAYSAETLLSAQSSRVEEALWVAVRLLEEKAEMARKLKAYSTERKFKAAPKRFEDQALKLEADAKVLRDILKSTEGGESD
jgi:two-component system, chemotaxis family, protein-glutamate methylesterase/glutaminase